MHYGICDTVLLDRRKKQNRTIFVHTLRLGPYKIGCCFLGLKQKSVHLTLCDIPSELNSESALVHK